MPTARELLEQADALMRRNRARQVDTEVPELSEVIPMPATPPPAPPVALADIPELTDAVEEIEIASILEIPDDDVDSNEWLRSDDKELAADIVAPLATATPAASRVPEPISGRVLPLFAIAGKPHESADAAPPSAAEGSIVAATTGSALAKAPVVDLPVRDTTPSGGIETAPSPSPALMPGIQVAPSSSIAAAPDDQAVAREGAAKSAPPAADDWARWQALAEEIRMQVLQRIDIFTDTGLREQLSVQMQPIVERASAEMVATINAQVGTLLRAYIAEAIEREIEKWREGNT
jgi:hypothetical protein